MLAKEDLRLDKEGIKKNRYAFLQKVLPHRSLDAIKSRIKRGEYKDLKRKVGVGKEAEPRLEQHEMLQPMLEKHEIRPQEPKVQSLPPLHMRPEDAASESSWKHTIWAYLDSLGISEHNSWGAPLLEEAIQLKLDGDELRSILDEHASEMTSRSSASNRGSHRSPPKQHPRKLSNRQKRRLEYKKVQNLFRKKRTSCAELVLSGAWKTNIAEGNGPARNDLTSFWRNIMEAPKIEDNRPVTAIRPTAWEVIEPITKEVVRDTLKGLTESSPGPDGVSLRMLKSIPLSTITKVFNLWMLSCSQPRSLRKSRTILIPKVSSPTNPGEFRPITIGPMITRVYHKILGRRLGECFPLKPIQRAFRPTDGCAENIMLLDALLENARQQQNPLQLAFLDLRKAFDSVHHSSIRRAAIRMGTPPPMVAYITSCYVEAVTTIHGVEVHQNTGVKQGDPLSPILFNAVLDEAFSALEDLGPKMEGIRVSALGLADDAIIATETGKALQHQVDIFLTEVGKTGLRPNARKCSTLSIKIDGKKERWVVDKNSNIEIEGEEVPSMGPEGVYKYLGINIGAQGRRGTLGPKLHQGLEELSHAPLKPQQRLYLLRAHLIPKVSYVGVLGKTTMTELRRLDRHIRNRVRAWLRLPKDTPTPYFHADAKYGGLGVPSLATSIGLMKTVRFGKMAMSDDPTVLAISRHPNTQRLLKRWGTTKVQGTSVTNKDEAKETWASKLHCTIDGAGLAEANLVSYAHRWVTDGTRLLTGRNFIDAVKIRGNLVGTRSRSSRGRPESDPYCPHQHCNPHHRRETLGHISQQCPGLWGLRIRRHNRLLQLVEGRLRQRGMCTRIEPHISTPAGVRKPDLICWGHNSSAWVLDAQITSDSTVGSISLAHKRKIDYYDNTSIRQYVARESGTPAELVKFSSITINWRGCWCAQSARDLEYLGIRRADLMLMSVRTLEDTSYMCNIRRRSSGRQEE